MSLRLFEDACDRRFFRATMCMEDGSVAILEYNRDVGYVAEDRQSMFGAGGGGGGPDRCRQEWMIVRQ
jgi:hypothetical protein